VDRDGTTVDDATYTVRQDVGLVVGTPGVAFTAGPYTLTADVGWSADPEYATVHEPVLAQAIIEYATYLHQQRTPGARTEGAAGTSVTYDEQGGIPARIARALRKYRSVVGVMPG
jgi:hypothetical protein